MGVQSGGSGVGFRVMVVCVSALESRGFEGWSAVIVLKMER